MERHLGLETFVRASAERAVISITTVGLVENEDKLQDYVQRPNKKYAEKMMQIYKYPVTVMDREALIEKLYTVERWKGVFEIQGTQVHLRNFTDVENRNFESFSCEINLHLLSDNSIYEALLQILELWGDNMITDIEAQKARAEAVGK